MNRVWLERERERDPIRYWETQRTVDIWNNIFTILLLELELELLLELLLA